MTVGKVLPFGARGSRNYAPPCTYILRYKMHSHANLNSPIT